MPLGSTLDAQTHRRVELNTKTRSTPSETQAGQLLIAFLCFSSQSEILEMTFDAG